MVHKRLYSAWKSLFTNVQKYDVTITSSAAMNLYIVKIYHSLCMFTAFFV